MGTEEASAADMYAASTEPGTNDAAVQVQDQMENALSEWKDLLLTLVPEKNVKVTDITGATHMLRCHVPATVETDLSRMLDMLLDAPDFGGHFDRVMNADNNGDRLLSIMKAITSTAQNHEVLQILSDAFAMAHPRATKAALANLMADEEMREWIPEGETPQPKHAFSRMELVGGLFPFALKEIADGRDLVMRMLPMKSPTPEA